MATPSDVEAAIASALTEIGINGRLIVCTGGRRVTSWMGSPTGDDVEVTVVVTTLAPAEG